MKHHYLCIFPDFITINGEKKLIESNSLLIIDISKHTVTVVYKDNINVYNITTRRFDLQNEGMNPKNFYHVRNTFFNTLQTHIIHQL